MSEKKPAAIYMDIDDLYPAPDNPRINDHVVDKIVRSIQLHGFAAPIVANMQGEILAGHTRWKAAKKLNMLTVPVRQMNLTGDQARLYRIADNKLSEFADWDEDMLKEQLADLMVNFEDELLDMDFELQDLGHFEDLEDQINQNSPEVVFSEFIDEANNYVVLLFENEIDWLSAKSHFNLKTKTSRRQNGKPWSSGIGRVIDGAEYLEKITNAVLLGEDDENT